MNANKFKRRRNIFRGLGYFSLGTGTLGGFLIFQATTNWSQFQSELENFVVVQEESLKLNMTLALPILISMLVFIRVTLKKNREFFKDKVSLNILMTLVVLYSIYSVITLTLATLVGAFIGAIGQEFIFEPIAISNDKKYQEEKDMDVEYDREKVRIKARKMAREDLDGSV